MNFCTSSAKIYTCRTSVSQIVKLTHAKVLKFEVFFFFFFWRSFWWFLYKILKFLKSLMINMKKDAYSINKPSSLSTSFCNFCTDRSANSARVSAWNHCDQCEKWSFFFDLTKIKPFCFFEAWTKKNIHTQINKFLSFYIHSSCSARTKKLIQTFYIHKVTTFLLHHPSKACWSI